MNSSNKEVNYLMQLLSCALNGTKPDIAEEGTDFSALFALAKKHQIYNIIYPLISDMESVSKEEKENWRNYNLSEITRMLTVNHERSVIFNELTENEIRFMPLKGLILKNYYPKESMRQMSDNDILYDFTKRDILHGIMVRNGYKAVATGENSDDYFKQPYSTFEFHRELFFKESDFCPHFDNLWDNAYRDKDNPFMYHMNLNDVYVYSVCHMYKHFSTAGCGVRFLADIYVFLRKEKDNLDWGYIHECLEQYGISEYEKESRELAFKLFGEKELSEKETALFETYINFGIYGSGKIRLAKNIEKLADSGSVKNAKKKYIFKRLFPSRKKMIADYRVLEKKPWLLPAYYIVRLFKGAVNGKSTISEIKAVNEIKDKK